MDPVFGRADFNEVVRDGRPVSVTARARVDRDRAVRGVGDVVEKVVGLYVH
jgi:hypothetical protein